MQKWKDQYRTEGFIVGLLVGAASAALASLLFAPKAGKDLRKDIGDTTHKAWDQASGYIDTAKDKGHEVAEDVSEKASSYFNVAGDVVDKAAKKTKGFFKKKTSSNNFQDKIDEVAKVSENMNKLNK